MCEYEDRCLNNDKCLICTKHRLLKLPEDKKKLSMQSKARVVQKKKDCNEDSSESWKDLESAVASRLSAVPTVRQYNDMRESRRQVRSGAIWFMPGDVTDTVVLSECKERSTITAKGEKTITIPRGWLTKIHEEAESDGKYPSFMFRYKNDETIYSINEFDVLCDMVLEIKYLRNDNVNLTSEKEKYLRVIKQQEAEIIRLRTELEEKEC